MQHGWKSLQLNLWNQRALNGGGTGIVPFRKLEFDFVAHWIHGLRVLDAGCGLGELMQYLRKYNPSLILLGFDFADEMVSLACQSDLNVFRSDITNLKIENGSVDTSIAIRTIKNILEVNDQKLAVSELARVTTKRIIIIDSVKESMVTPPDYNLYLSRDWLITNFLQEGFRLIWEEYFKVPVIQIPIIASSRRPIVGSDEGFFVFDREKDRRYGIARWRFFEIIESLVSMARFAIRKIIKLAIKNHNVML